MAEDEFRNHHEVPFRDRYVGVLRCPLDLFPSAHLIVSSMGGFDPVRSPSASIVVGNPTNVGTGYMSVRQPLLDTVSA